MKEYAFNKNVFRIKDTLLREVDYAPLTIEIMNQLDYGMNVRTPMEDTSGEEVTLKESY